MSTHGMHITFTHIQHSSYFDCNYLILQLSLCRSHSTGPPGLTGVPCRTPLSALPAPPFKLLASSWSLYYDYLIRTQRIIISLSPERLCKVPMSSHVASDMRSLGRCSWNVYYPAPSTAPMARSDTYVPRSHSLYVPKR